MLEYVKQIEKWGLFEVRVSGKSTGNPFEECEIYATFNSENEQKKIKGFYDGNGEYVVRFMPSFEGKYNFELSGNFSEKIEGVAGVSLALNNLQGEFEVTENSLENHGPLMIKDTYHFSYMDGTPYYSLGTTCYAFVQQKDEMVEQTLDTLSKSGFNKIRFCIFPKHYDYNYEDPMTFPYVGTPCDNSTLNRQTMFAFMEDKSSNSWDFKRFKPEHFKRFDYVIKRLMDMGIQADIILFHPYDRWGFDGMGALNDDFYVRYVINRFSAYRNVWWSLANEYDYVKTKTIEDWDRIGTLIMDEDPYQRFRSVHNGPKFYDFSKTWVTHCSCQGTDRYKAVENTDEIRKQYNKPVVWDEVLYEGNIDLGWGNITGEELTRRFWEGLMRGGYVGHGETILPEEFSDVDKEKLWWAHGGTLKGTSPERIAFLGKILSEIPGGQGLKYLPEHWDSVGCTTEDKSIYILYYSYLRPLFHDYYFDDDTEYSVDVIDTWNMIIEHIGTFKGKFRIRIGGRPYMAVRFTKIN